MLTYAPDDNSGFGGAHVIDNLRLLAGNEYVMRFENHYLKITQMLIERCVAAVRKFDGQTCRFNVFKYDGMTSSGGTCERHIYRLKA